MIDFLNFFCELVGLVSNFFLTGLAFVFAFSGETSSIRAGAALLILYFFINFRNALNVR